MYAHLLDKIPLSDYFFFKSTVQWRQTYLRLNNPLPKDVGTGGINYLTAQCRALRKALLDGPKRGSRNTEGGLRRG